MPVDRSPATLTGSSAEGRRGDRGRLIHRYAIWIVGVWALAAIVGTNFAATQAVITAEDQPFAGWHRHFVPCRGGLSPSPAACQILSWHRRNRSSDRATFALRSWPYSVFTYHRGGGLVGTRPSRRIARSDDHPAPVTAAPGGMVGT